MQRQDDTKAPKQPQYGISLNREAILAMLQDFHLLTGIRVACMLPDATEGVHVPEALCDFCELLRGDAVMDLRCRQCDRHAFADAERTREPVLYHCHAGICEAVAPLFEGDRLLGYLMMGQTLEHAPTEHDWRITASLLGLSGDANAALHDAFFRIPSWSKERIAAAFRLLAHQAELILAADWVKARFMPWVDRLEAYIHSHLQEELGTRAIARAFGISASRLGHLVKEQTGRTVTAHVRAIRLEASVRLLRTTSLPVHEIAVQTGWQDPRYFARVFQQALGMSPSRYRMDRQPVAENPPRL